MPLSSWLLLFSFLIKSAMPWSMTRRVEDVSADPKAHKVVVKGRKAAADPMKVVEHVRKKTGRKVDLLLPIPPSVEEKKEEEKKKEEPEPPKPEEKKEPSVIIVVLKVHMHCETCAQTIKKRILKMKGVQSAEPDLKASEVAVKGVFDGVKLVEYVHKRTGKFVTIVKSELVEVPHKADYGIAKDEKDEKEENKNGKDGGRDNKKEETEKAGGNNSGEGNDQDNENDYAATTATNLYIHCPQFAFPGGYCPPPAHGYINPPLGPMYAYAPPPPPAYPSAYMPHIFGDENPHACSVM